MKVQELIEELKKLPQDHIVILQKDSEGNGYSPLCGIDEAIYIPENTWSGEVVGEEDLNQAIEDGVEEELFNNYDKNKLQKCCVLFPIN